MKMNLTKAKQVLRAHNFKEEGSFPMWYTNGSNNINITLLNEMLKTAKDFAKKQKPEVKE